MDNDTVRREPGPGRLGGYQLTRSCHVCAFFSTPDEEYEVLMPFIREGFEAGAKAFHTIDPARLADHERRLGAAGIDVAEARRTGQLDLRTWDQTHLCCGTFKPKDVSSLFEKALGEAESEGFTHTRFISHMGWAAQEETSSHRLLDYEARANHAALDGPASLVVCVYDLAVFSADFVLDVMRTHPLVLVGGTLYENPLYVPPVEFLRGLRERVGRLEQAQQP
jgi:MEDS: MEthanogen/methylotroph, DcmR Sensory domain